MSAGWAEPAGSGRALRLDPLTLPVRFRAADPVADGRIRLVEIDRHGVVLRRCVAGMRIAVALPTAAFIGVALRLGAAAENAAETVAVVLEHRDPALSVPLFAAPDATDVLAEWRLWARILRLPLLVVDENGALREAFAQLGAVRIARPCGRRRRRQHLHAWRPRILMRRKPGRPGPVVVHREREIIARN
jgi:hypothetical protein